MNPPKAVKSGQLENCVTGTTSSYVSTGRPTCDVILDENLKVEGEAYLGGPHYLRSMWTQRWKNLAVYLLAIVIPILFPTIHMYIFRKWWGPDKEPVDKTKCECSCWDTVFLGPSKENGIGDFKHVYFNVDLVTLKMMTMTFSGIVLFYTVLKRFFYLLFNNRLRWTMGILFVTSLHSHYFAWWVHWNYMNDEFYKQWNHQIFFTVTELISFLMVLSNMDKTREVRLIPLLVTMTIAVFHGYCSGVDQFVYNVLLGQGDLELVLRDIVLMWNDASHAGLSFLEVKRLARRRGTTVYSLLSLGWYKSIVASVAAVMFLYIVIFPAQA